MSTSDIDFSKRAARTAFFYLLSALFVALFGSVYELFSHEVYSFYMIYAFLFPLLGGTLPFLMLSLYHPSNYPGIASCYFYHCGIATLTVGSMVKGILDIYGTTNQLVEWYWRVGFVLVGIGIILQCNKRNL